MGPIVLADKKPLKLPNRFFSHDAARGSTGVERGVGKDAQSKSRKPDTRDAKRFLDGQMINFDAFAKTDEMVTSSTFVKLDVCVICA